MYPASEFGLRSFWVWVVPKMARVQIGEKLTPIKREGME
jgi:hypothetical protein